MKRIKKVRKSLLFLIIIAIILGVSAALFINKKKVVENKVTLELKGNNNQVYSIKDTYEEKGIDVKVNGKELTDDDISVETKSDLDMDSPGEYTIRYNVSYDNKIYEINRNVTVEDNESPVITTTSDTIQVFECKNKSKNNLQYKAIDNYDGIITSKVKVTFNSDSTALLSVSDSAGNETNITLPVENTEEQHPIIVLDGKDLIYVPVGKDYKESGAHLEDGCGKKIKGEITIDNPLDNTKEGIYEVTYTYMIDENTTIKNTRTVIVYTPTELDKKDEEGEKIVYLTFDDGPGAYTEELLDILDKYDVKATFFVTGQFKKYLPLIKEEYNRGHKVAVHTYSHKWNIYDSVQNYLYDFNEMNKIIYEYTGEYSKLFRFPGGSSNTVSRGHATGVVRAIGSSLSKEGYVYFDWNVDSNDAGGASSEEIKNNVIKGIQNRNVSVVLMHDIHKNTINVIEEIIKYGVDNGYTFKTLDENSKTVHHSFNN